MTSTPDTAAPEVLIATAGIDAPAESGTGRTRAQKAMSIAMRVMLAVIGLFVGALVAVMIGFTTGWIQLC